VETCELGLKAAVSESDLGPRTEKADSSSLPTKIRNHFSALLDNASKRIETSPMQFLGLSIFLILIVTLAHAKRRLWFDELHTIYISRLPSLHDVWLALLTGVDFNPPVVYLATRFSIRALGTSPTAMRFPEILLFLVMCLSIFTFVRRRCGVLYGLAAMWFPLITVAAGYSSEARPHALVLGFCALAMVSWQKSAEGGRRGFALALMSISIAGFLLSHCYAVLILIAFGTAELVRFAIQKKPDWPLWACMIIPISAVGAYVPMLRQVREVAVQSVSFEPGIAYIPRFFSFLLNNQGSGWQRFDWHQTTWPLIVVLLIAGLSKRNTPVEKTGTDTPRGLRSYELAFVSALSLLPVFGQTLAMVAKSPFNDRYALSAVIGVTALLSSFVFKTTYGNQRAALSVVVVFVCWFCTDFGTWFYSLSHQRSWDLPTIQLASLPKDVLIVVSDPLMFLEAEYYEPPQVVERLRLLTDPSLALAHSGTDMFDRGYYKSHRIFPFHGQMVDYKTFLASTKHFKAYGPFEAPEDWLFPNLLKTGAVIKLEGQSNYPSTHGSNCMLLDVTTAGS
jgi:hypothetical protein